VLLGFGGGGLAQLERWVPSALLLSLADGGLSINLFDPVIDKLLLAVIRDEDEPR